MHSGLLLFLWLVAVAGLQFLNVAVLTLVLGLSALVAFRFAPQRSRRLLKRIRFILLAIVILFAGFTPGEAVLVDWPTLSPSREGVLLAYEHAARVAVVVLFVALLMEYLPPTRLVGALHALLRPFNVVGVPADRVAVRTLLVLRFVEAKHSPRWDHWISDDSNDLHDAIDVERERFGALDLCVLGMLVMAGVGLWWWA
ncbi:MAG TPA: CbiQ family ECF transporter T component [Azoarcus sp.]|nr:CbiQ family ECF transporter T component [Azoarcus sp.]